MNFNLCYIIFLVYVVSMFGVVVSMDECAVGVPILHVVTCYARS